MKLAHILIIVSVVFTAKIAFAANYLSAHSCQPYRSGGTPGVDLYYQNTGSILAAGGNGPDVSVTCPLNYQNAFPGNISVRVYYSSFGVTAAPPLHCRVWKSSNSGDAVVGTDVSGTVNTAAGFIDVFNQQGLSNPIGANIECWMKPGTKILGLSY